MPWCTSPVCMLSHEVLLHCHSKRNQLCSELTQTVQVVERGGWVAG